MSKISATTIDDIFNIPRDGSNIVDDDSDAYAGINDTSKVSFEEKVAEVNKDISRKIDVEIKKEIIVETEKNNNVENDKNTSPEELLRSVVPSKTANKSSSFDDLFGEDKKDTQVLQDTQGAANVEKKAILTDIKASISLQSPVSPVETKTEVTPVEPPKKTEDTTSYKTTTELNFSGKRKHKWKLESNQPKYNFFYQEKRDALESMLLIGGEIDFDAIYSELEQATVDISVGETFVPDLVCKKMEEVQQWRDRIKQLQLQVNRQFFHWERSVELFEGLLSRTEYERGKQDGVKYEHMYDMEMYFSSLKMIHKSIDNVSRILDGAFECLSRQVTIAMPMKEIDRYNTGQKNSSAMKNFDGLKTNANGGGSMSSSQRKPEALASGPTKGWPE